MCAHVTWVNIRILLFPWWCDENRLPLVAMCSRITREHKKYIMKSLAETVVLDFFCVCVCGVGGGGCGEGDHIYKLTVKLSKVIGEK